MDNDTTPTKEQIAGFLTADFEQKLFTASLGFLDLTDNPLRFNAFAFSLRELLRHVMDRLAPDASVKECRWFAQDPSIEDGRLTRFQRFKYAVQRGLDDAFVADVLNFSVIDYWPEVRASIDSLSKLTHVGPNTFGLGAEEVKMQADGMIEALWTIFAAIEELSSELESLLHDHINQAVVAASLRETNAQIDILSSNSVFEGAEISNWEITSIDSREILFSGEGAAHVFLEWGRGKDRAQIFDEFPFSFSGYALVVCPTEPEIESNGIQIDTTEWYE